MAAISAWQQGRITRNTFVDPSWDMRPSNHTPRTAQVYPDTVYDDMSLIDNSFPCRMDSSFPCRMDSSLSRYQADQECKEREKPDQLKLSLPVIKSSEEEPVNSRWRLLSLVQNQESKQSIRTGVVYPDTVYDQMSRANHSIPRLLDGSMFRSQERMCRPSLPVRVQSLQVTGSSEDSETEERVRRRLESVVSKRLHQRDAEIDQDIRRSEGPVWLDVSTFRCHSSEKLLNNSETFEEPPKFRKSSEVLAKRPGEVDLAGKGFKKSWTEPASKPAIPLSIAENNDGEALKSDESTPKPLREAEVNHPHNCIPCRFHCFSLHRECEKGDDCGFCHLNHVSRRLEKKLEALKNHRRRGIRRA